MYETPFPHSVIDNFFDKNVYQKIVEFGKNLNIGLHTFNTELENLIEDKCWQLLDLRNKLISFTEKPSCVLECNKNSSEWDILYNVMAPQNKYKIHRDSDWKQLTVVVYTEGINLGTQFHISKTDDTVIHQIDWRPNRALIFVPAENTWHSYSNPSNLTRNTVIMNLGNKKNSHNMYKNS